MKTSIISNCQEVRRFEYDEPILIHARFSASGHRVAAWGYSNDSSIVSVEGSIWETETGNFIAWYDPAVSTELEFSAYNFGQSPHIEGDILFYPTDGAGYSFTGHARFPSRNSEFAVIDARKAVRKERDTRPDHYLFNCRLWQDYQTNDEDYLSPDALKSIDFLPDNLKIVDISADGQRLLAAEPWKDGWHNIISVWDVESQRCVATLEPDVKTPNSGHLNTIKSATFLANRQDQVLTISYSTTWGAATGTDNVAGFIWDATEGIAKVPLFCWKANRHWDVENIHDYALLNHGRWIALIRGDAETGEPNDQTIKVLDTGTGLEVAVFEHPPNQDGYGNSVARVAADLEGTCLISTSENESFARVWNVTENCQIAQCKLEGTEVVDVDMKSINGSCYLLTTHCYAMAVLWKLPTS
ncbi:MAG: hypothetical protein V2I41_07625 [Pseudomonadales bacterium]|jgi:WD40 repeat protein|nr:hypothetical protein [Pseudomonadales bacterium]